MKDDFAIETDPNDDGESHAPTWVDDEGCDEIKDHVKSEADNNVDPIESENEDDNDPTESEQEYANDGMSPTDHSSMLNQGVGLSEEIGVML